MDDYQMLGARLICNPGESQAEQAFLFSLLQDKEYYESFINKKGERIIYLILYRKIQNIEQNWCKSPSEDITSELPP